MQEPSADMIEAARRRPEYGINLYNNIFNAMRDQLLRRLRMNNNIVKFTGITKLDLSALKCFVLLRRKPQNAFVICWPEDGSMPTYHSNTADTAVVLMRLHGFIHKFYNGDFDEN